jgi:hypothetical protein
MKKILLALVTAVFALGLVGQAEAAKKKTTVVVTPWGWGWNGTTWVWTGTWGWGGPWTVRDPKLAASNFWVGAGSTAAYFGIRDGAHGAGHGVHSRGFAYGASAIGCAAVSPIVGTLVVNRPLTTREVFISTANCAAPFVGGWMVNAWFDRNGWK